MSRKESPWAGFTIVELLIVIVVIGILAAITIVAYNGVQARAQSAKRDSDLALYYKAITAARINTGKTLGEITGNYYSAGYCNTYLNTANIEPRDLPKSDNCWVVYYSNLDKIGTAANVNLDSLKVGDSRGNPYVIDENEGEGGNYCRTDSMFYFTGNNADTAAYRSVPLGSGRC